MKRAGKLATKHKGISPLPAKKSKGKIAPPPKKKAIRMPTMTKKHEAPERDTSPIPEAAPARDPSLYIKAKPLEIAMLGEPTPPESSFLYAREPIDPTMISALSPNMLIIIQWYEDGLRSAGAKVEDLYTRKRGKKGELLKGEEEKREWLKVRLYQAGLGARELKLQAEGRQLLGNSRPHYLMRPSTKEEVSIRAQMRASELLLVERKEERIARVPKEKKDAAPRIELSGEHPFRPGSAKDQIWACLQKKKSMSLAQLQEHAKSLGKSAALIGHVISRLNEFKLVTQAGGQFKVAAKG